MNVGMFGRTVVTYPRLGGREAEYAGFYSLREGQANLPYVSSTSSAQLPLPPKAGEQVSIVMNDTMIRNTKIERGGKAQTYCHLA